MGYHKRLVGGMEELLFSHMYPSDVLGFAISNLRCQKGEPLFIWIFKLDLQQKSIASMEIYELIMGLIPGHRAAYLFPINTVTFIFFACIATYSIIRSLQYSYSTRLPVV